MRIGIRAHDIFLNDPSALTKKIKSEGLGYVQLVLKKSFNKNIEELNEEEIQNIVKNFQENDLQIAMLGSYFNPVHSNKEFLKTNIERFKNHLRLAKHFNTRYVGTETGSYLDDPWDYHPRNHLEESYCEVREVVRDLVRCAEKHDAVVLIEGAYNHLIYEPKLLNRLVREINSDNLRVTIDLFNYLNTENYLQQREIFDESLSLLKDKISVFHLKDFIYDNGKLVQVGLGQGLMDYPYYLEQMKNLPDAVMIMEGIQGEDIASSVKYLKKIGG